MTALSNNGQWALWYPAHVGAPVFALWWADGGRCACGNDDCGDPGKHPIPSVSPHGVNSATSDPAVITRIWTRYPEANIGLATGHTFDALDLDYFLTMEAVDQLDDPDTHEGDDPIATITRAGHVGVVDWLARGELGPISQTGKGRHVLVQPTGGKNRSGVKGGLPLHVDWRAKGGYIVAPPSVHITGNTYQWLDDFPITATIPAAPPALVDMLADAEKRTHRPTVEERISRLSDPVAVFLRTHLARSTESRSPRYAQAALEAEAAEVAAATKGGRNDRLNVAALKLGRYVISGELDEGEVYSALMRAAEASGQPARASEKTIGSGLFGATKPVAA